MSSPRQSRVRSRLLEPPGDNISRAGGRRLTKSANTYFVPRHEGPKIAEPPRGRSAFVLSPPETTRWRHLLPLPTRGLIGTEAWLEIRLMDGTYDGLDPRS